MRTLNSFQIVLKFTFSTFSNIKAKICRIKHRISYGYLDKILHCYELKNQLFNQYLSIILFYLFYI